MVFINKEKFGSEDDLSDFSDSYRRRLAEWRREDYRFAWNSRLLGLHARLSQGDESVRAEIGELSTYKLPKRPDPFSATTNGTTDR